MRINKMPKSITYEAPNMNEYINPQSKEYYNIRALASWHSSKNTIIIDYEKKINFCKNFSHEVWELYEELYGYWKNNKSVTIPMSVLLFTLEWGRDKYYKVLKKAEEFGIIETEALYYGTTYTCLFDYLKDEYPIDYCKQAYDYINSK